jgi:hypothetical protein
MVGKKKTGSDDNGTRKVCNPFPLPPPYLVRDEHDGQRAHALPALGLCPLVDLLLPGAHRLERLLARQVADQEHAPGCMLGLVDLSCIRTIRGDGAPVDCIIYYVTYRGQNRPG